jgi:hypothetical protein
VLVTSSHAQPTLRAAPATPRLHSHRAAHRGLIVGIFATMAMPTFQFYQPASARGGHRSDVVFDRRAQRGDQRNGPVEVRPPPAPIDAGVGSNAAAQRTDRPKDRSVQTSLSVWRPHPSPISTTDANLRRNEQGAVQRRRSGTTLSPRLVIDPAVFPNLFSEHAYEMSSAFGESASYLSTF